MKKAIFILFLLLLAGCTKIIEIEKECPECQECICEECICPECEEIKETVIETKELTQREIAICEMERKADQECKTYRKTQEGYELVGKEVCDIDEYAYTYPTNGVCICKKRVCEI